jgi:hypothetical protein
VIGTSGPAWHSVGAVIRPGGSVIRVIRATEAVVIKAAANETAPSKALVANMRHVACPKATDPTTAKAGDATAAEATDVATAEATHVTAAKATHVASSSAAAAGLCTRGEKAAGKHRACQNHRHSSSHDILR